MGEGDTTAGAVDKLVRLASGAAADVAIVKEAIEIWSAEAEIRPVEVVTGTEAGPGLVSGAV